MPSRLTSILPSDPRLRQRYASQRVVRNDARPGVPAGPRGRHPAHVQAGATHALGLAAHRLADGIPSSQGLGAQRDAYRVCVDPPRSIGPLDAGVAAPCAVALRTL